MKGHNYGICLKCGKIHTPNKPNLGKHLQFSIERNRRISVALKGKPKTEETKRKISLAHMGKRYSPETNAKKGLRGSSNPFYGRHHTESTKAKLRLVCREYGNTPEANRKKSMPGELNPFYGKHHTPDARKRMSEAKKKLCQDPKYLQKIMIARDMKPNKSERTLDNLLNKHYPGKWKYVGDGRDGTSIGGKVPDWININGSKAVIELFSDYWHSMPGQSSTRTAEGTLKHYACYGFKCLIIDWKEVRHPSGVLQKVAAFTRCL